MQKASLCENNDSYSAVALRKEFKFGSAMAIAFSVISPIVALYAVLALALQSGGAAAWWGFGIAVAFQLIVALVFAELVSKWPLAGGIYQWTRKLAGEGLGWLAGWVYMCTLIAGLSAVSYGSGLYIAGALGIENPTLFQSKLFGLGVLIFSTIANTVGRKFLKCIVWAALFAELVGSIGVATWLLLFHRVNDFSIVFSASGTSSSAIYLLSPAFAGVMAIIGFSFFGFESAGSIAEEVRSPGRAVPRAMIFSMVAVGLVVTYSALAIILAIPDVPGVVSGAIADPVVVTLQNALGDGVVRPLLFLFAIAFIAGAIAIQTGVSRVMFGFAREDALPGSKVLSQLSVSDGLPLNAIYLSAIIVALIFVFCGENAFAMFVSLCAAGYFLSFMFPTFSALYTRLKGRWQAGEYSNGRWGTLLNCIAAVWLIAAGVNVAWPRTPDVVWYVNCSVLLAAVFVLVSGGLAYMLCRKKMKIPSGPLSASH